MADVLSRLNAALSGRYAVERQIGEGGMATVYLAQDLRHDRRVALKVLKPELAAVVGAERFLAEIKTTANLQHPHILPLFDSGQADGMLFYVMPYVEGESLRERLDRERQLPVDEAVRIATDVAEALEHAHSRGVIHRDIKPANILLLSGNPVISDFGIALAVSAGGGGRLTETGLSLGTPHYMSPEQATGDMRVGPPTDVYALGCVLYEMLVGEPPYTGSTPQAILGKIIAGDAVSVTKQRKSVPANVDAAIRRAFEKVAADRFSSAGDFAAALAERGFTHGKAAARAVSLRSASQAAAFLGMGALAGVAAMALRGAEAAPDGSRAMSSAQPVTRFVIAPPATAPLADQGSLDLAISPDGRRIAYLVRKLDSGRIEIFVRDLDGLEARPVPGTEAPNIGLWNPFFAPDGQSIGYVAPGRGLVSVALDGRPPVRIADGPDPFFGAWWADDNTIIYSTPLRLQRISAAGGGTPSFLMPERETGAVGGPQVLPGGRAVLFHVVGAAAGRRVAVLDLATGDEKTLVEGASFPSYVDTGHLVFFLDNTLMAATFDVEELAVTGEPVALMQGIRWPSGGAPDFALSANGTLAYVPDVAAADAVHRVVWVDRTGTVTGRALPEPVVNARSPRLSPDRSRLLLVTGPNSDGDLWSYDLGGRPPVPIALQNDVGHPAWSPDSRQVAFHTLPLNATMTLPADGSELAPRTLSTELYLYPQVWTAAGELIVTRFTNRGDIATIPADATGELRDVVASDAPEFNPALSSNGRWLAYSSGRSGQNEIWVQRYPDGIAVRLTNNGGYEPVWSADGRELFYRQGDAVMAVAVEAGDELSFGVPAPLFTGPFVGLSGSESRSYDVAPNGQFLMILPTDESPPAAPVTPATIVVVQNFGEELKQRVRPRRN